MLHWADLHRELWADLEKRAASNPRMVAAEEVRGKGEPQWYACPFVSHDGSLHLLIEKEVPKSEQLVDPKAAGLRLSLLQYHLVLGRERQDYIDLCCTARPHLETFTEIVREICQSLFDEGEPPTRAVSKVIRRWRSFWGKPFRQTLSEAEQLGLFGELFVLNRLAEVFGNNASVSSWKGPCGEIHDFEFSRTSLEVKTTSYGRHLHVFHGLRQLEITANSLFVISVLAQRVEIGGQCLLDLVNSICGILSESPDEYEEFHAKLELTGFRYEHGPIYQSTRFSIVEAAAFPVNTSFPRIVQTSFAEPPSARITDLKYALDLTGLESMSMEALDFYSSLIPS